MAYIQFQESFPAIEAYLADQARGLPDGIAEDFEDQFEYGRLEQGFCRSAARNAMYAMSQHTMTPMGQRWIRTGICLS